MRQKPGIDLSFQEEFRHIDERCFTIAKILEHIDNID
jgi:hypothetical protein